MPPTLIPQDPTTRGVRRRSSSRGGRPRCCAGSSTSCSPPPLHAALVRRRRVDGRRTRWPGWSSAARTAIFAADHRDAVRARLRLPDPELPASWTSSAGWTRSGRSIVPGAAGAFGVFFLRQFFIALPRGARGGRADRRRERVDRSSPGSSCRCPSRRWRRSRCCRFLGNWNDFLWPMYVLFSPERLTLPPGLRAAAGRLHDRLSGDHGRRDASPSVPVLILYVFVQRYVIEGVARSGIKG